MAEVPQLHSEIEKMNYLSQREMVNLTMNYHKAVCSEYECVNYTKHIPKVTYKFELLSGVTYHNNYYAPQAGFLIHIWRPLKNEKLYFKTGIIYSDRPYFRKDPYEEVKYDYNIKIPVSFQYVFGKKNFKPTIALGWTTGIFLISSFQSGFTYSFTENIEFSFNASVDGLIALPVGLHKEIFDNNLAHTISVGIIYNIQCWLV